MSNVNLSTAKETKNDEFYTQLSDIQTELSNYSDKFIGKVVFCNCDDPFESSFVKYFLMNFNRLGLKELIATGYKTSPIIGEEVGENGVPYVLRVISTSKYLVGTQTDLDNRSVKILSYLTGLLCCRRLSSEETKPCMITKTSHISHCIFDSARESTESYLIEKKTHVKACVKMII